MFYRYKGLLCLLFERKLLLFNQGSLRFLSFFGDLSVFEIIAQLRELLGQRFSDRLRSQARYWWAASSRFISRQ
jgi:hypothetical protein